MISFFGDQSLKDAVRRRVAEHQRLDQIAQRVYWKDGRGCFIGCSLHSNRHADFERLLGLPEWFARLGERIFEMLPADEAVTFPLEVYDATPVGVDLTPVRDRFLDELLAGIEHLHPEPVAAVRRLLRRRLAGDEPTKAEWADAAGWAASEAAWAAAWAAANAAANAAAKAAAKAAEVRRQRALLVRLLRECGPVTVVSPELPADPVFLQYRTEVMAEVAR